LLYKLLSPVQAKSGIFRPFLTPSGKRFPDKNSAYIYRKMPPESFISNEINYLIEITYLEVKRLSRIRVKGKGCLDDKKNV